MYVNMNISHTVKKKFRNTHTQTSSQSWLPYHSKPQANYHTMSYTAKTRCNIKIYDNFKEINILEKKPTFIFVFIIICTSPDSRKYFVSFHLVTNFHIIQNAKKLG